MKILCKYALISAIVLVLILLIRILNLLGAMELPSMLISFLVILENALFVGFFCGLFSISSSTSPLKTPSLVCAGGYVALMVSSILFLISVNVVLQKYINSFSTWVTVGNVIDSIGIVLIVVGLIWISRYYTKGSSQQIATYFLAIVMALSMCAFYVYSWLIKGAENPSVVNKVYNCIVVGVTTIASALFMFEFSKLKK